MNVDSLEDINVEEVVKKLCLLLNIKSDRKLSIALGLSVTTLGVAKNKGKLPWDEILKLCKARGISVDSLLGIDVAQDVAVESLRVREQPVYEPKDSDIEDKNLREINELVDTVIREALEEKTLSTDAELRVYKNVRPMLVDTALRYGKGSESFMRRQLSSALAMLL